MPTLLQNEIQMYFRVVSAMRAAPACRETRLDTYADLRAIVKYSKSGLLRARCIDLLPKSRARRAG